ncbi:MAG: Asp23/Gls24 family envelope stress response protein [Candidatus Dormibacteraeota bacterium]|uniref:Asp23/Gls24 family envelope stress response protein n=1 Tax=Candidatus Nephthysia bennettiae TaxID=3127016 RepID=A0A934KCC4_9BACT|nr:Asp23/Gls24 family envelope stress response protein [Candidatus Dormibacteraeota bacterium]
MTVKVGERQAAVDLDIVTYYGQSIVEVSEAIRRNVIERIEGMVGLQVTEVNITVDDLYFEGESERQKSRVL